MGRMELMGWAVKALGTWAQSRQEEMEVCMCVVYMDLRACVS